LGIPALFTGPLQHRHLQYLWPLAAVSVVPSVFPEAFGMVAAEAASCGCPPLVARHSGLAEVDEGLSAHLPPELHLTSFETGNVNDLTGHLQRILALPAEQRETLRAGCRRTVQDLWSWDSVAQRLTALGTAGSHPRRAGEGR
jgi:glycosyltransferase involved in cell wall biosynthesis